MLPAGRLEVGLEFQYCECENHLSGDQKRSKYDVDVARGEHLKLADYTAPHGSNRAVVPMGRAIRKIIPVMM